MPDGLSSSSTPSTRRRATRGFVDVAGTLERAVAASRMAGARSVGRMLLVGGDRLVDQLRHAHARFDRVVVGKMQLRHRVEVESMAEFAAQKARGSRQRLHGGVRAVLP